MASDPLRFRGRVAGELGRIAWSSIVAGPEGIPRTIDALEFPWINEALSEHFRGALVTRMEILGGDSGTTERRRVGLTYARDARPVGAPESYRSR